MQHPLPFAIPILVTKNFICYHRVKRQFSMQDTPNAVGLLPWASMIGVENSSIAQRPLTLPVAAVGPDRTSVGWMGADIHGHRCGDIFFRPA